MQLLRSASQWAQVLRRTGSGVHRRAGSGNLENGMTPSVAVLFVFVTHGAVQGPAGDVVAACLRALPAGTRPISRTVAAAPTDAALAADAKAAAATAAVVVSWPDANLLGADVRAVVGLPDRARWIARAVTFSPGDQLPERVRALGLVIASVVQEGLPEPEAKRSGNQAVVRRALAPPPAPPAAQAGAPGAAAAEEVTAAAPAEDGTAWGIDARVTTAFERGTDGDDIIGGGVGLRRLLPRALFARLGLGFRLTERDVVLTGRSFNGMVGLGWSLPRFGPGGAFTLAVRLDLLAMRESVRVSQDRPLAVTEQAFWSGAVDALLEPGLGLSRATMLLAAVGLEERFTEATVVVPGRDDATLSRGRLVVELGILSRF